MNQGHRQCRRGLGVVVWLAVATSCASTPSTAPSVAETEPITATAPPSPTTDPSASSTTPPTTVSRGDSIPSSVAEYSGKLGDIIYSKKSIGSDDSSLFTIDADGTNEQLVRASIEGVQLSPDGRTLCGTAVNPDGLLRPLMLRVDGSGEDFAPLADATLQLGCADWSPDGTRLFTEGWDVDDPSRNGTYTVSALDGGLVRVSDAHGGHDYPLMYSPDGNKLLFMRPVVASDDFNASMNLFVVNADGSGLVQLNPPGIETSPDAPNSRASWSPDGQHVAFLASKGDMAKSSARAIFVVAADGSNLLRITDWSEMETMDWSPDGTLIAFTWVDDLHQGIYTVHPDGTGLNYIPPPDRGLSILGAVWSPDSSKLLFPVYTGNIADLWTANADGTDLVQVTHAPGGYDGFQWVPR